MIGTSLGSAALLYTLTHNPISFLIVAMLMVHEFGHYFSAKLKKYSPDLPFFIPLLPLIIGITRVKDLQPNNTSTIAFYGPFTALVFLLTFILHNYIYLLFSFVPLYLMFGFETFFNYFGSDGRKYRKYKSVVHT
jgi:hypothetical protein